MYGSHDSIATTDGVFVTLAGVKFNFCLHFYCAMLRRARLCYSKSCVCLSVRPYVTLRYEFHTGWNTSKIISLPNSLRLLFGLIPTWANWCNGNTLKIVVE